MTGKASEQYLAGLVQDMREAVLEFRRFDRKWNQLNNALNEKWATEGKDMVAIDQMKSVNITLKGHMSGAQWWRDKAAMLAAVIEAEAKYMEVRNADDYRSVDAGGWSARVGDAVRSGNPSAS